MAVLLNDLESKVQVLKWST